MPNKSTYRRGDEPLPVNLVREIEAGLRGEHTHEALYYFERTKSGRYAVRAIYTGMPVGTIGSGGKSFATPAEREAALRRSIEIVSRHPRWSHWKLEVSDAR